MGDKLLSLICFLLSFTFLTSCEDDKKNQKFIAYKGPIEDADSIRVIYSEGGLLKVRVNTAKQLKYADENKIFPKPVFIDFFDPMGSQVITTLRSDSGRYDNRLNVYKVMGNVVVINTTKRQKLSTDELIWNPATKKVYTEKPVIIESQATGERINGLGLDANQDFTQYSVRKVTGYFNAPSGMTPN
jgi:LPS export ABC transporter protein LptC